MLNQMSELEMKISSVKTVSNVKFAEKVALKRKPDLCYDLEYILDRVAVRSVR